MRHHKIHHGFHITGRNIVAEAVAHASERVSEVIFVQDYGDLEKNSEVVKIAQNKGIHITKIDRKKADKMFGDSRHQGIGAYYRGYTYSEISDIPSLCKEGELNAILFLDRVEDVYNFGAMVRTATAFGVCAVVVAEHEQAPVNAASFTTSAGTIARMPIIQVSSVAQGIAKLKEYDFWAYGIDMDAGKKTYTSGLIWEQKFDANTIIVVGAEGQGLSAKAKEACDFIAPIPMENEVESLNVSVAAAVALYEWKRQVNK